MTAVTKVFINGNSQAVRIPAAFRLDTDQVRISRNAAGDLVLRPIHKKRGDALLAALEGFDADFVAALEQGQREAQPVQERDAL
ncbi:MAG: AbrB/MazE/SpoVT family DNA-binding domain-containing protein [Proteobacteria bacterium]|nr:AbrB/MazE/SpoVT family DNA-binding domain-containing protein [Pseudomonadota bacterium]